MRGQTLCRGAAVDVDNPQSQTLAAIGVVRKTGSCFWPPSAIQAAEQPNSALVLVRGKRLLNYPVSAGLCYQRLLCLRICNHFASSQDIFPPADYGGKRKKVLLSK